MIACRHALVAERAEKWDVCIQIYEELGALPRSSATTSSPRTRTSMLPRYEPRPGSRFWIIEARLNSGRRTPPFGAIRDTKTTPRGASVTSGSTKPFLGSRRNDRHSFSRTGGFRFRMGAENRSMLQCKETGPLRARRYDGQDGRYRQRLAGY